MNGLTLIHIAGGSAALLAGTAALAFRKGGRVHVRAGLIFVAAMLVLASTGAVMAAFKPERLSAMSGILTLYLVATAWAAARRKDGRAGRFEIFGFLFALACAATLLTFGMQAANRPTGVLEGFPAPAFFVFAGVAALAAALDLNFILRGSLARAKLLARHLWRMCAALFIASGSLFLGQQDDVFPFMEGSPILFVPALAPLVLMVFWLLRVRLAKGGRSWTRERRPGAT